jgi:hypothetical protein
MQTSAIIFAKKREAKYVVRAATGGGPTGDSPGQAAPVESPAGASRKPDY